MQLPPLHYALLSCVHALLPCLAKCIAQVSQLHIVLRQCLQLVHAPQPRALLKLNLASHVQRNGASYCDRTNCGWAASRRVRCDKNGFVTSIWGEDTTNDRSCFLGGVPTTLPSTWLDYWSPAMDCVASISSFTPDVIDALLTLKNLQAAIIFFERGAIPTQLGGLTRLRHLVIRYGCLDGALPQEWNFSSLSTLMITGGTDGGGFLVNQEPPNVGCGISGTIPLAWVTQMRQLRYLYLPYNQLSGSLHPDYRKWRSMVEAWLEGNALSGSIPAQYASWGLQTLRLSYNKLSGRLPTFATGNETTSIRKSLQRLDLSDNQITGEHFGLGG